MNGLSVNAWRDPWHVRALREMRRWGVVRTVAAWGVRAWIVVGWIFVLPYAIYRIGGAS